MSSGMKGVGIARLGQVAVNVQDVARATAFYRDVLGLPFLFAAGQLAFFDCGGVRLMLDRPEKPEFDHPSSILYFLVPDIQAAHRRLLLSFIRHHLAEDRPLPAMAFWDKDAWTGTSS